MRSLAILFLSLNAFVCAGCANSQYWMARVADASSIFTATVGIGGGLTARTGPVHVGLFVGVDALGLRNGCLLNDFTMIDAMAGGLQFDSLIIPIPGEELDGWFGVIFGCEAFPCKVSREGEAGAISHIPFVSLPCPLEANRTVRWQEWLRYCTQIEIAGGLVGTVRIGFSPMDLIDFLFGWTTIDILDDDHLVPSQAIRASRETFDTARGAL